MYKNLKEIIENFNTTPFLFVGSGITRRYYNLPSWKGLLEIFISKISSDEFAFASYENKAKELIENESELYPQIAELIEKDFNNLWFKNDRNIRNLDKYYSNKVKQESVSPFKAEVAMYIKNQSNIMPEYIEEIEKLKKLSIKSISGIITTNYDDFFEDNFEGYKRYVGQDELIFSGIQGIGEIYKIHGTIEEPKSIVIDSKDYSEFDNKSSYLAAKLMTIFIEHPIIFIGYSISDINIQKILNSIIKCLDTEKIAKLKNRFIFIEYNTNVEDYEISEYTMKMEDKFLEMTKIKMSDFSILYDELYKKKNKIPAKILRYYKDELYNFVITNEPTNTIKVGNIEDERIKDEELVMAIGKVKEVAFEGLKGFSTNEWYRDIVMNDKRFKVDDILEQVAPKLLKGTANRLPLNKYLSESNKRYEKLEKIALENDFDNMINNSIKKGRHRVKYNSIKEIWEENSNDWLHALDKIAYLKEEKINVDELEDVLTEIFKKDNNIFESNNERLKSHLRRCIRIYDYLKYGDKIKEPSKTQSSPIEH